MNIDYSLYLVTDRPLCGGRDLLDVVKKAVRGGVSVVQLREKNASTREFLEIGSRIKSFLDRQAVPLIINDRLDIALALEASGVHLGNSDMPFHQARRILGPDRIIGLSAESIEDAVRADRLGADYIGISPIFTTPTKPELDTGLGIDGLRRIRKATFRPLVAIGGMNAANSRRVVEAGADGIAVVSAICSAADPEKAAKDILREIRKGRKGRHED